ncbi:MAG: Ig-like domain-containing protein, partial [Bacillota bacterium]|nr:Ig-like domain-containing protein [Bacillota bacterium]
MSIKKFTLILCSILLVFAFAGCLETTTTTDLTTITETPITLELTPASLRLAEGASAQLAWTVVPAGTAVVFTTSDETVAAVNAEGLVHAIGPGSAEITAVAGEAVATCDITVVGSYVLTAPNKTIYALGDELSLRGGSIAIFDAEGILLETVALSAAMITGWNPDLAGEQVVGVSYDGIAFGFPVLVLSVKQADCRFDDFIVLTAAPVSGEKIEFALTKADLEQLEGALENVYDYTEIDIYAYVTSPSGDVKKVSAFWYQEYRETSLGTAVNRNNNLEGNVTILSSDVAIVLGYMPENDPQYRLRYLTGETGAFTADLYVKVDGAVIQTFEKEFTVAADATSDYKGYVIVDETNLRHFAFSDGGSYIPVGQNVAWYTSRDRRYYDYVAWFDKMGDVGMNYARVWMAAWGFSIFWDDV